MPSSILSESYSENRQLNQVATELADLIQNNTVGTIERLFYSHVYCPKQTSWSSLIATAQQDFSLIAKMSGNKLTADLPALLIEAKPDAFGSFSTRIAHREMTLGWQALARTNALTSTPLRSLVLAGNKGVVHLSLADPGYKIVDFRGKTVAKTSSKTAFRLAI
ncbi:hypothetical protein GCM10027592_41870 [Spirosoma flavus]